MKIIFVIRGQINLARTSQAAKDCPQIYIAEKPPFMMSFFGPWIRKVNMKAIYGLVREIIVHQLSGIGPNQSDITQTPASHAIHGITIIFIGPFDTQIIYIRIGACF
jgi:hypothetical protein